MHEWKPDRDFISGKSGETSNGILPENSPPQKAEAYHRFFR